MKGLYKLLILCGIVVGISACDKVDNPYEGIVGGGGEIEGDSIWSDTTHNFRKMYVEEFTGHTCFNCPRWTKDLVTWSETDYDNQMVMTSIHWGSFAEPQPNKGYVDDWRCEPGGEINDKFGILSNPSILINRVQTTGLPPGQWRSNLDQIASATVNDPALKLKLLSIRNGSLNKNKLVIMGEALKDIQGEHLVGLMLVTDSLIAPQMLGDRSMDTNYIHRHMIRDAIGPSTGNAFIREGLAAGEKIMVEFDFEPNPTLDTAHMLIHAFVRNSSNDEVIQSEEVHVTKTP